MAFVATTLFSIMPQASTSGRPTSSADKGHRASPPKRLGSLIKLQVLGSSGVSCAAFALAVVAPSILVAAAGFIARIMGPLASIPPAAALAEQIADPSIFLTVGLIRFAYPTLFFVNLAITLFHVRYFQELTKIYQVIYSTKRRRYLIDVFGYCLAVVISFCILFVLPYDTASGYPGNRRLELDEYFAGSIAPALMFGFGMHLTAAIVARIRRNPAH